MSLPLRALRGCARAGRSRDRELDDAEAPMLEAEVAGSLEAVAS